MENVIKQGYLKKGNSSGNWLSGLFRRNDGQKWFVFTIRNRVPYLEYYDNDVEVFIESPINSYCLSQCHSVRRMGRSAPHNFSIVCSDRFIELIASSRTQMLEWVNAVESSLIRLNILQKEPEGNVYTVLPAVVRQPRVSKEVLEEREAAAASQAAEASSAALSQATGASPSAEDVGANPPDESETPESTAIVIPPAIPRRPLPSVPGTALEGSSDLAPLQVSPLSVGNDVAAKASVHDSSSSDFVSWDVLMRIREAGNTLGRSNSKPEGSTSENEQIFGDSRCVSLSAFFQTNTLPEGKADEDLEPLLRVKSQRGRHFETEDNDSDDSESMNDSMDISALGFSSLEQHLSSISHQDEVNSGKDNEYSLLPEMKEKAEKIRQEDKKLNRPVPLPRRGQSVRQDYDNAPVSNNAIGPGDGFKALSNSRLDWPLLNGHGPGPETPETPDSDDNGAHNCSTLLFRPCNPETSGACSKPEVEENVIGNLYSPVLKKEPKFPPTHPAPPIPRSITAGEPTTSSSDQSAFDDTNEDIYRTNVSSKPASIEVSAYSLGSHPKNNTEGSDQSSNPPIPLPRRRPTGPRGLQLSSSMSHDGMSDIPPLPPRRASPKISRAFSADNPPSLPSRSTQSFIIKRPQIFSFPNKSEDASDKNSCRTRALPPLPQDDDESSSGSVAGARDEARASGLSHKMLLDRAHSLHTVVSLKQTQVEILQNEIDQPHIEVSLTQKSGHGLALIDWNGMPCIAGWNQKSFPMLHGKLHIGDIILSVNSIPAASPEVTQKLLRQPVTAKIEVMLQRMPYAKVFAIRRNAEGQSLGMKREGGTGEIIYVDPHGLAAQHGLTSHAEGFGGIRCNWFLTEINSRPLNLFFKENEIMHRLCAVGREISIVVQPSDFIFEIRRQLKKVKNYKNFIVQ